MNATATSTNNAQAGPAAILYTGTVRESHKAHIEEMLAKASKIASKLGLPAPTATFALTGHVWPSYAALGGASEAVQAQFACTVVGAMPIIPGGWQILASIDWLAGGAIVRKSPAGMEYLGTQDLRAEQACHHCNTSRERKQTYWLRSEEGKIVQVGSTCIKDFLGHSFKLEFELTALLSGLDEEGEEREYRTSIESLGSYLAWCIKSIGERSFVSSQAAQDSYGEKIATSADALELEAIYDRQSRGGVKAGEAKIEPPTDAHFAEAKAVIAWVLAGEDGSEYMQNAQVLCRQGYLDLNNKGIRMHRGIVASLPAAKYRAEEAIRKAASPKVEIIPAPYKAGDKIKKLQVRYAGTSSYMVQGFGYRGREQAMYVHRFEVASGDSKFVLVWKTTSDDLGGYTKGEEYLLSGTVADNSEYKGMAQTLVQRCKLEDIAPDAPNGQVDSTQRRQPMLDQWGNPLVIYRGIPREKCALGEEKWAKILAKNGPAY